MVAPEVNKAPHPCLIGNYAILLMCYEMPLSGNTLFKITNQNSCHSC